jgi:4-hydroxythreonine-4-phosphate dehydrogenase
MTLLLVTMGDAVGIGPETICKAFVAGALGRCAVVGEPAVLRRAAALLPVPPVVAVIERPGDTDAVPPGVLPVLPPSSRQPGLETLPWGRVDARAGAAAARCIEDAVTWVLDGEAAAIVTAPIHKEALAAAGVPFPGHTELLEDACRRRCRPADVRMMLANEELRTVLVSVHCSLREAIERVTVASVLETLRITHQSARAFGFESPRIAVPGLNPHAGEGGLFGDEERRFIVPAIEQARAEGIDATGPYAPDTVYMRARQGEFDFVLAMYHDQGLIPVKYLGVEEGVNVTLGLPLVRTSPDHGTAFDKAGRGVADASSLVAAARMARALSGGNRG